MMSTSATLLISIAVNILLLWYVSKLLKKFFFISETISDLFLTTNSFQIFVKSLYGMDNYNGEPMIQELIYRIKEVTTEIENFRDVFDYTLDTEIEEELNVFEEGSIDAEKEAPSAY